ncbi:MAG: bifunctional hydroxymethylpyrimidine kinase/phosphomethylpyrimidine kinase [Candidatus Sumerlaeia bacterium]
MHDSYIMPLVLTIAGSDSGGGAGIQADLKTFCAFQTYGTSAITALTAQNTRGVQDIYEVSPAFVSAQIDAIMDDMGTGAAKTGMLASAAIVEAVAAAIQKHQIPQVVVDPVMVAKGGSKLLQDSAVRAVKEKLLPLAKIVTPNTEEARVLTGMNRIENADDMEKAARKILDLGPQSVLLKGGHLGGDSSNDLYMDANVSEILSAKRLDNKHTHGTGCTLSAAIAACLAHGKSPLDAVRRAKEYVSEAIRTAPPLGHGIGPVNHLWPLQGQKK